MYALSSIPSSLRNAYVRQLLDRYGEARPSYPPGEVATLPDTDARKHIRTHVNMTAVASRHMQQDDMVQWIYHSPHLAMFIEGVRPL